MQRCEIRATSASDYIRTFILTFISGSAVFIGALAAHAAKTPHTLLKPSSSKSFRDVLVKITSPKCGASLLKSLADYQFDRWTWRQEPGIAGQNTFTGYALDSFVWADANQTTEGNAEITVHAGSANASIRFNTATCRPEPASNTTTLLRGAAKPPSERTLYYSWSSGMILSLEGMSEILQVAKATDSKVVFLSDAKLVGNDLKKWRSEIEKKIQSRDMKWLSLSETSNEEVSGLLARGIRLHYPSILIAENGSIQPFSFPGHKPIESWKSWIETTSAEFSKMKGAK